MTHIILLITHNLKELEDFYDDHDDTDYEFSHDHPYADELPTQVVGKNHKQNSAHMHVTGQSRYFDDIPYAVNEGFLAPVLSERPHAKDWFIFLFPVYQFPVKVAQGRTISRSCL